MKLKEKLMKDYINKALGMRLGTYNFEDCMERSYIAGFEKARELALRVCEINDGGADFVGPGYSFYADMEFIGEEEVNPSET